MIAVLEGRLDDGALTVAERALLGYVKLITEESYKSMPEDVQKLRDVGWTENQIAEAVYITAMFAFFNRVADSFGIPPQNYLMTGKLTP
jgi:alkylhydroperoxidase family enzyme